ncbi:hypothetical protein [Paucibacter soli]|uniref:hypothetical protein n=1 Tax=Paucibacter soli TaxID=3133433 RepID=UPI00309ECF62
MLTPSSVQTLLKAVRRHLWRQRCIAAIRCSMWSSSGLMLLVAALHLSIRALPVEALPLGLALIWLAALAWAAWQRPALPACAIWADCELGGASAFSTLLEAGPDAHPQALRWLEQWAVARVPQGMSQLAQRPAATPWLRALLSLAVCASLAALVLSLPSRAPAARPGTAPASTTVEPALALADPAAAEAPDAAQRLNDIAGALRASAARAVAERRESGPAPASQAGNSTDAPASAPARADAEQASASAAQASPALTAGAGTGNASGREAGSGPGVPGANEAREARIDAGGARPRQGRMNTQEKKGSASSARAAASELQADMDGLASYEPARPEAQGAAVSRLGEAAAATPPAALAGTELSPTETSYVQAWMKKSSGRTR